MLLVKILILIVGGGAVAGVTYSQIQQDPDTKTVVVSNNHESKIRASLEKKLDQDLLNTKKNGLNNRKNTAQSHFTEKEKDFKSATKNLTDDYQSLNNAKTTLNTLSKTLENKYTDLMTKDNEFKVAIETKMAHDLKTNEYALKKEFYEAQKKAYDAEKNALKIKIEKIRTSSSSLSSDICGDKDSLTISDSTTKTTEETKIENELKQELLTVCDGLTKNGTEITTYSTDLTDSSDFSTKNNARNDAIAAIRSQTVEYNSQIIKIKSAESAVQMKLLRFNHAEQALTDAKRRLEEIKNNIEVLDEKINSNI